MPPILPARCRRYNPKPPNQTYRTDQLPEFTGTPSRAFMSSLGFITLNLASREKQPKGNSSVA